MKNIGNQKIEHHISDNTNLFIFNQSSAGQNNVDMNEERYKNLLALVVMKTYKAVLVRLLEKVYEGEHGKIAAMV